MKSGQTIIMKKRWERAAYKFGYHYVYVISEAGQGGPCKIGVADRPNGRLSSMQSGNARKLRLVRFWRLPGKPASHRVERAAHASLTAKVIRGEWFDIGRKKACAAVDRAIEEEGLFVVSNERLMADIGYEDNGLPNLM